MLRIRLAGSCGPPKIASLRNSNSQSNGIVTNGTAKEMGSASTRQALWTAVSHETAGAIVRECSTNQSYWESLSNNNRFLLIVPIKWEVMPIRSSFQSQQNIMFAVNFPCSQGIPSEEWAQRTGG
jgi:hypothetical protein